jgi:hypothetical protein
MDSASLNLPKRASKARGDPTAKMAATYISSAYLDPQRALAAAKPNPQLA